MLDEVVLGGTRNKPLAARIDVVILDIDFPVPANREACLLFLLVVQELDKSVVLVFE